MKPNPDRKLQRRARIPCMEPTIPAVLLLLVFVFAPADLSAQSASPDVGQRAPDFTLQTPEGAGVDFNSLLKEGKLVLVVLRGYPGYQCPYC